VLWMRRVRGWPESSRTFQTTVPTLVELVVPLKPLTQTEDAFGGVTKSLKELEMQDVAPPLTKMSNESESNIAREDL
jgi:hypothetical protein